jgi:succinylglutamate desuccinylase
MKIKALKDHEYLKGMLYLEKNEDNLLLETDRHFYKAYNLVRYVIQLHDDFIFPFYPKCIIEYMEIAQGMQLIRDLPNL